MSSVLDEQRRLAGIVTEAAKSGGKIPSLREAMSAYAKAVLEAVAAGLPKRLKDSVEYGETLSLLGTVKGKGTSASDLEANWSIFVDVLDSPLRTRINVFYKDVQMFGDASAEFKFGYAMDGSSVASEVLRWFSDK
jgi:hypothetical protein